MSRLRNIPGRATGALGLLLLVAVAAACSDDGKTAPEKCGTPPLHGPYDLQGGAKDDDGNPCVTPVGHSVSQIISSTSGGNSTGGSTAGSGGKGSAGSAGKTSTAARAARAVRVPVARVPVARAGSAA